MQPGGARMKGQDGEREIIKMLEPIVREFGEGILSRNLNQTREGGFDIVGIDWLAIEVKRQETLNVSEWWQQTLKQAGYDRVPILIYRQNRKAWQVCLWGDVGKIRCRVTISVDDFKEWLREELKNRSRTG